ncbi:MAG: branched-chain amino acid ABC transporter permease [Microthrixaceae bacterium]
MDEFLRLTILGLCTASIFALAASGLVLTYTTTGVFNFAHGAIGMLGAFAYWQLQVDWGWPVPVALAVVLLVLAPALGIFIERVIMRGLIDAPETIRIVVTISLLAAMLGLGLWVWSPQEPHQTVSLFQGHTLQLLGVRISWHQATSFLVAVAVAIGLRLLLFRTRAGLDMRAAVDSRPLAMLHGARPDRSAALAWGIGCSLAALAGILISGSLGSLSHVNLTLLIVSAYAAAMVGRLRSLPLTFLGAVILGLADSYAIGYVPATNSYFSTFRFVIPVVVLFVVLLVLPDPQLPSRSSSASREEIPLPKWRTALFTAAAIVACTGVLASVLTDADALRVSKIFGIALIALSLVPLTGFAGQVSLCQMSFAGIGAIVMAHHGQGGNPMGVLLAGLICGAVGALIALPALRLSGIYLALSTAAFAVFLDRWFFTLPAFDIGPVHIKVFDLGVIAVRPLDIPGIDTTSRPTQLMMLSVVFALAYLLVVAVRRSMFGQRLLAMKDSPAACATLGIDLTRLKLAVFSMSAAMAGVGGALYGATLGSMGYDRFNLFESLPLLLLAVVGGIGSASGALFAGAVLGGSPITAGIWPFLTNINRVLPGTMGVALGRNPNGAVRDIAEGYRVLAEAPFALVGLLASLVTASALAVGGVLTGWGLTFAVALSMVAWPAVATGAVARRRDRTGQARPLEWAGLEEPLSPDEVRALDAALGVDLDDLEASRA